MSAMQHKSEYNQVVMQISFIYIYYDKIVSSSLNRVTIKMIIFVINLVRDTIELFSECGLLSNILIKIQ